jgi:hypothetical protein
MKLGLVNTLTDGRGGVAGLDPDAKAYIDTVVAAGATVSGAQRTAINNFYKTAKAGGWYSQLKRLYFPIWGGSAAPNAIDMISTLSGSFVGTLTYTSGYVSGNGTTGYFIFDLAPSALGLTTSSASIYGLFTGAAAINGSVALMGCQDTSNSSRAGYRSGGVGVRGVAIFVSNASTYAETDSRSVLVSSRTTTTTLSSYKRTSSGFVTTVNESSVTSPVVGTTNPMALGNNNNGTVTVPVSTIRYGAYGMGLGLTAAQAESFSLALKTLWETCTGLTLP